MPRPIVPAAHGAYGAHGRLSVNLPAHAHRHTAADRDAGFIELLSGLRHSGGLARAGDLTASIERCGGLPIETLARWMVRGEVLHFEWQAQTWLPMFQFSRRGSEWVPTLARVLAEWAEVLPAWELAQWFAHPHSALDGRRPADAWAADADGVVQAARADRYLADA